MPEGKEMVLGFVFDAPLEWVALIRKQRPDWQKGKWNGIGGRVQPGEDPLTAMVREFEEEAGLNIPEPYWTRTVVMDGRMHGWRVHVFTTNSHYAHDVQTKTDEVVAMFKLSSLHQFDGIISNLSWLIPLQLEVWRSEAVIEWPVTISYEQ